MSRRRGIPLLGKGGGAARFNKMSPSYLSRRADGVVGPTSSQICADVDRTTPSAPFLRLLRGIFDGRGHPSLAKEGKFLGSNPFTPFAFIAALAGLAFLPSIRQNPKLL